MQLVVTRCNISTNEAAKGAAPNKGDAIMKTARKFLAEYCPYGCNCISDGDALMRFESAAERDEMVARINAANPEHLDGCARAITRKDAAGLYRLQDFGTEYEREVRGSRTCAGRPFFEVGCKRGGRLY